VTAGRERQPRFDNRIDAGRNRRSPVAAASTAAARSTPNCRVGSKSLSAKRQRHAATSIELARQARRQRRQAALTERVAR